MCDAFGWTYEQYRNQPKWFLTLLRKKRNYDHEQAEKNNP